MGLTDLVDGVSVSHIRLLEMKLDMISSQCNVNTSLVVNVVESSFPVTTLSSLPTDPLTVSFTEAFSSHVTKALRTKQGGAKNRHVINVRCKPSPSSKNSIVVFFTICGGLSNEDSLSDINGLLDDERAYLLRERITTPSLTATVNSQSRATNLDTYSPAKSNILMTSLPSLTSTSNLNDYKDDIIALLLTAEQREISLIEECAILRRRDRARVAELRNAENDCFTLNQHLVHERGINKKLSVDLATTTAHLQKYDKEKTALQWKTSTHLTSDEIKIKRTLEDLDASRSEAKGLREELDGYKAQVSRLESELSSIQNQVKLLTNELDDARGQVTILNKELEDLIIILEQLQQEKEDLGLQNAAVSKQLKETLDRLTLIEGERKGLQLKCTTIETENSSLSQQLAKVHIEKSHLTTSLSELEVKLKQRQQEHDQQQKLLRRRAGLEKCAYLFSMYCSLNMSRAFAQLRDHSIRCNSEKLQLERDVVIFSQQIEHKKVEETLLGVMSDSVKTKESEKQMLLEVSSDIKRELRSQIVKCGLEKCYFAVKMTLTQSYIASFYRWLSHRTHSRYLNTLADIEDVHHETQRGLLKDIENLKSDARLMNELHDKKYADLVLKYECSKSDHQRLIKELEEDRSLLQSTMTNLVEENTYQFKAVKSLLGKALRGFFSKSNVTSCFLEWKLQVSQAKGKKEAQSLQRLQQQHVVAVGDAMDELYAKDQKRALEANQLASTMAAAMKEIALSRFNYILSTSKSCTLRRSLRIWYHHSLMDAHTTLMNESMNEYSMTQQLQCKVSISETQSRFRTARYIAGYYRLHSTIRAYHQRSLVSAWVTWVTTTTRITAFKTTESSYDTLQRDYQSEIRQMMIDHERDMNIEFDSRVTLERQYRAIRLKTGATMVGMMLLNAFMGGLRLGWRCWRDEICERRMRREIEETIYVKVSTVEEECMQKIRKSEESLASLSSEHSLVRHGSGLRILRDAFLRSIYSKQQVAFKLWRSHTTTERHNSILLSLESSYIQKLHDVDDGWKRRWGTEVGEIQDQANARVKTVENVYESEITRLTTEIDTKETLHLSTIETLHDHYRCQIASMNEDHQLDRQVHDNAMVCVLEQRDLLVRDMKERYEQMIKEKEQMIESLTIERGLDAEQHEASLLVVEERTKSQLASLLSDSQQNFSHQSSSVDALTVALRATKHQYGLEKISWVFAIVSQKQLSYSFRQWLLATRHAIDQAREEEAVSVVNDLSIELRLKRQNEALTKLLVPIMAWTGSNVMYCWCQWKLLILNNQNSKTALKKLQLLKLNSLLLVIQQWRHAALADGFRRWISLWAQSTVTISTVQTISNEGDLKKLSNEVRSLQSQLSALKQREIQSIAESEEQKYKLETELKTIHASFMVQQSTFEAKIDSERQRNQSSLVQKSHESGLYLLYAIFQSTHLRSLFRGLYHWKQFVIMEKSLSVINQTQKALHLMSAAVNAEKNSSIIHHPSSSSIKSSTIPNLPIVPSVTNEGRLRASAGDPVSSRRRTDPPTSSLLQFNNDDEESSSDDDDNIDDDMNNKNHSSSTTSPRKTGDQVASFAAEVLAVAKSLPSSTRPTPRSISTPRTIYHPSSTSSSPQRPLLPIRDSSPYRLQESPKIKDRPILDDVGKVEYTPRGSSRFSPLRQQSPRSAASSVNVATLQSRPSVNPQSNRSLTPQPARPSSQSPLRLRQQWVESSQSSTTQPPPGTEHSPFCFCTECRNRRQASRSGAN